jgi:hypothetical protein
MAMTNAERDWVSKEITKANGSAKLTGFKKLLAMMKEYGSVAAYIGLVIALCSIIVAVGNLALSQHSAANARLKDEAVFEERTKTQLEAIKNDLKVLKDSLTNVRLTSSLNSPVTPRTAATVAQVTREAIRQHQQIDPNLVSELGKHLVDGPNVAESWDAAATLLAYRYQTVGIELPNNLQDCYDTLKPNTNEDVITIVDPATGKVIQQTKVPGFAANAATMPFTSHIYFENCSLSIDDRRDFAQTSIGRYFADVKSHHPNLTATILVLNNVRVVYHGVAIIPVNRIEFSHCIFDLRLNAAPPLSGKSLTRQLLVGEVDKGVVSLHS